MEVAFGQQLCFRYWLCYRFSRQKHRPSDVASTTEQRLLRRRTAPLKSNTIRLLRGVPTTSNMPRCNLRQSLQQHGTGNHLMQLRTKSTTGRSRPSRSFRQIRRATQIPQALPLRKLETGLLRPDLTGLNGHRRLAGAAARPMILIMAEDRAAIMGMALHMVNFRRVKAGQMSRHPLCVALLPRRLPLSFRQRLRRLQLHLQRKCRLRCPTARHLHRRQLLRP